MKISIITVVYNCAKTIGQCVESVVGQSYSELEHIVIDGNSTDGTTDVLKKYSAQIDVLISENDDGIYDAMNKGIRLATGDIIGILNADDYYPSYDILSKVAASFKEMNYDGVYGDLIYVDPHITSKVIRYWKGGCQKSFLQGWHPPHPTFFVRKSIYEKFGLYDTTLKISADFEMMFRLIEKEELLISYIPEVLVHMRNGGTSNKSFKNVFSGFFQIRMSFIQNGYNYPFLYPFKRYSSKIRQYFAGRVRVKTS